MSKKKSGSKKFRARVLLCSKDEVKKFKRVGGSKILGLKIIWVQNLGPKRVCAKRKFDPKILRVHKVLDYINFDLTRN